MLGAGCRVLEGRIECLNDRMIECVNALPDVVPTGQDVGGAHPIPPYPLANAGLISSSLHPFYSPGGAAESSAGDAPGEIR